MIEVYKPDLCWKCKQYGGRVPVYIKGEELANGYVRGKLYNYNSQGRHWHVPEVEHHYKGESKV
jgi:hypothetical protein